MATHNSKTTTRRAAKPAHDPKEAGPVAPALTASPPASAEEIRRRAYLRWEAAGKPSGDGIRFWLEAEQELLHGK